MGFIEWIQDPDYGVGGMATGLGVEIAVGLAVGVGLGFVAVKAFQTEALSRAGLYPVATLSVAALAYGLAEVIGGSGFLAVYLSALALGSAALPEKRVIVAFHRGAGWFAQLTLFLTLGLLVVPSQLPAVAVEGTLLALVLVFVARPLAVFSTVVVPLRYSFAEGSVLVWAGLRGAVPVGWRPSPCWRGPSTVISSSTSSSSRC